MVTPREADYLNTTVYDFQMVTGVSIARVLAVVSSAASAETPQTAVLLNSYICLSHGPVRSLQRMHDPLLLIIIR